MDGINLLPILQGRVPHLERTLFWRIITQPDRRMKAVRQGRWKYLRDGEIDMPFDLEVDPHERDDLSYQQQARVRSMQRLLDEWEQQFPR